MPLDHALAVPSAQREHHELTYRPRQPAHRREVVDVHLSPQDVLLALEPRGAKRGLHDLLEDDGLDDLEHGRLVPAEHLGAFMDAHALKVGEPRSVNRVKGEGESPVEEDGRDEREVLVRDPWEDRRGRGVVDRCPEGRRRERGEEGRVERGEQRGEALKEGHGGVASGGFRGLRADAGRVTGSKGARRAVRCVKLEAEPAAERMSSKGWVRWCRWCRWWVCGWSGAAKTQTTAAADDTRPGVNCRKGGLSRDRVAGGPYSSPPKEIGVDREHLG